MATLRSLDLARRLWKWQAHSEGQRDFMLCDANVKTAACGRRWGKSECSGVDIVLYALENPNTTQIVTAPTADQTQIIMSEVQRRLYSVPGLSSAFWERRSPFWEFTFKDGAGLLEPTRIMSRTVGPTGRGLRGRKAHRVIMDEAAFVSDPIVQKVISPLLADYNGQLVKLSTPDGMNHFHDDYQRGLDPAQPRFASFRFPSASNPYLPTDFLQSEKATKPERIYAQEYEAAFLEREGAVFRKIMAAATAKLQDGPVRGHEYVMGVDWGRSNDFTVLTVFDVTTRQVAALDRFNQIDWHMQRARLTALFQRFGPVSIVAEKNSIGDPNIEALQREGLPVLAFTTTNASKAEIIDLLALSFEQQTVKIPDDPTLTAELMQYAATRLPSGLMQYSAPEGRHDDCVISLALAVWGGTRAIIQSGPRIW